MSKCQNKTCPIPFISIYSKYLDIILIRKYENIIYKHIVNFYEKYSIPKSTLYDILTKYVTDNDLSMIKSLFEFNKRHK